MRRNLILSSALLLALGCGDSSEAPRPRVPARVVLSSNSVTTYPGISISLPSATVYDSADEVLGVKVLWTTGDSSIVMVSNNGLATSTVLGIAEGSSTATASVAGTAVTATAQVRVVREPVVSVRVNIDGSTLFGNDSFPVVAEAIGPGNDAIANRVVTLSSLTPDIATVNAGQVHIHSSGKGELLASSEGVVDTARFDVDVRRVARIIVSPDSLTLVSGSEFDHMHYQTLDAQGNVLNRPVSVTSGDSSVVDWDDYFNDVEAGVPGSAVLTFRSDTASARVYVTVTPKP